MPLPKFVEMKGSSLLRNMRWYKTYGHLSLGEWVALKDGQLIDHDPNRIALHARINDRLHGGLLVMLIC